MSLPSPLDLSNRTALITGAGSADGIGFATARLLGELGARLVLTATTDRVHERVDELAADSLEATAYVGDLTHEATTTDLVQHAIDTFGRLDVLVNNAGMVSASDPDYQEGDVEGMSLATWQSSLRRNLDTALLVSRAAVPQLKHQGWGRIVMVASVTGPVMAMRGDVAYAGAKAGMVGLAWPGPWPSTSPPAASPSTPSRRDGSPPRP